MLFAIVILCVATANSALPTGTAPTIEASGRDITIAAGKGGHIFLVENDIKGPGKEIQVGKLVATVSNVQASIGKLYVLLGGVQKTCSDVQKNVSTLGQTLAFVHSLLSNDVQSLKSKVDDETNARIDSVDEAVLAVQQVKTELKALIEYNDAAAADAIINIAEGIEAIDVDVASLGNVVDTMANSTKPSVATCGAVTVANGFTTPLESTKHIVGARITIACNAGFYRDGPSLILCGPSGTYCATDGQYDCLDPENGPLAVCKPCSVGCSTCDKDPSQASFWTNSSGPLCTSCQDPNALLVGSYDSLGKPQGGLCVPKDQAHSSCKELQKAGGLGNKTGTFGVKLVSPLKNKLVDATCIVLESGKVHTMIKCTDLQGKYSCITPSQVTDKNTCTEFGYAHAPFRSKAHYIATYKLFGSKQMWRFTRTVGGLSKTTDGGNYTDCVMRSGDDDSKCSADWQSVDGQSWWVADEIKDSQASSHDYSAGCYIGIKRGFGAAHNHLGTFDFSKSDENARSKADLCKYSPGNLYLCSSSDF